MATEVDEIGRVIVRWPSKSMRLEGCREVASEVNEMGGDVLLWLLKLTRLEVMSWCDR